MMKIYEVKYPVSDPTHLQTEYTGTKEEAKRLAREGNGSFKDIDVPTTKADLIAFLNKISK